MIQWCCDNDTDEFDSDFDNDTDDFDNDFDLLMDHDEIRRILHQYEKILIMFSMGIEKYGESYFSDILLEDDFSIAMELINQAKLIMAFINEEYKVWKH